MSFLSSQDFEASETTNYRFNAMETKSKGEVHQGLANLQNGIYARRVRKNHRIPEVQGFLSQICLWDL